jgi:hypothetical protein
MRLTQVLEARSARAHVSGPFSGSEVRDHFGTVNSASYC